MLKKLEQNYENFIFDMDGTLLDSSNEVLLCLRKACERNQAQIDTSNFSSNLIGPPLKEIVRGAIVKKDDDEFISKIVADFRNIYDNNENDSSKMYEGMYEWLVHLKGSAKRLFLATYKPTKPTLKLLKDLNLNFFEDIYTIDKYSPRQISKTEMITEIVEKYALNKSKTVMIGDAPGDVTAAKASGVSGVGVLWGYGNNQVILKEISDFVLELDDLKITEKI